ncbi:MarR family winged helix-turn-helix transcriptional regulator [Cellulomonas phragmiteti]|uniref:MarR family transcriptional regulator n=1 Tax=Cellulomonas phragmiteti TaxID=478780 RepID=A0ABQ4DQW9_9CELL|nr:MarR family transcriptional regulator [Cellulomonas phragmiteti]GIG41756.1 MarR family transcriptional regulator [Cellulomonas phragmiteti]
MDRAERLERLALLSEADATQTAMFQQAAAASYGLGITEMRALSILLRNGPQTAGALTRALHVTSGAVTGIVDRLVRRGLVSRAADPDDRRKVVVTVDLAALAASENAYAGIGEAFQELYAGYTDAELDFLERHLTASVEITARETARLHPRA